MKKRILFIGGDRRSLTSIKTCSNNSITCYLLGFGEMNFREQNIISYTEDILPTLDGIVLPVQGTDESGGITSSFTDEPLFLTEEMLKNTPNDCKIFTGATNDYLKNTVDKTNRILIQLFKQKKAAILNAVPTAEGVLELAMRHTSRTINKSNVLVLGYGNVGREVANLFKNVGANVFISIRNSSNNNNIKKEEVSLFDLKLLKKNINQMDICINTIPAYILTKEILDEVKQTTPIIDVASDPGGTNFKYAKKQSLTAIHALGLPGKIAPETAGEIMASIIMEYLKS